jgi:valyl-tRNA synthetase
MLGALHDVVAGATLALDDFDYARALELTERFFWGFCDDYLELVKQRAYGALGDDAARSARAALAAALSSVLRLFAPHLPFVTEEVWSWWQSGSVHRAPWPVVDELGVAGGDTSVYDVVAAVLGEVRKAKSSAQRSMRTEVTHLVVRVPADLSQPLDLALDDLREAARVTGELELVEGDALEVDVTLADPEA